MEKRIQKETDFMPHYFPSRWR